MRLHSRTCPDFATSPPAVPSGLRRRAAKTRVAAVALRVPLTSGLEHVQAKTRVWVFDFEVQARIGVFEQLKREIASGKVLLLRRTCGGRTLRCRRGQRTSVYLRLNGE